MLVTICISQKPCLQLSFKVILSPLYFWGKKRDINKHMMIFNFLLNTNWKQLCFHPGRWTTRASLRWGCIHELDSQSGIWDLNENCCSNSGQGAHFRQRLERRFRAYCRGLLESYPNTPDSDYNAALKHTAGVRGGPHHYIYQRDHQFH